MRFEREDARVGLLVLLSLLVLVSLAFHRAVGSLFQREVVFRLQLESGLDLAEGTPVLLQGHPVGTARRVTLVRSGASYLVEAELALRPEIVLWRGTRALLVSRLLGTPYLDLHLPPLAERATELRAGEVLTGGPAPSLDSLLTDLSGLVTRLDRALVDLRQELDTRGLGAVFENPRVRELFGSVDRALSSFNSTSTSAGTFFAHGDSTLTAADASLRAFDESVGALRDLAARRGPELERALADVSAAAERVRLVSAEAESFLGEAAPEAHRSLQALGRALESTEELLELLKAKPNRLVLGTPDDAERAAARDRARRAREATNPRP